MNYFPIERQRLNHENHLFRTSSIYVVFVILDRMEYKILIITKDSRHI